MKALILLRAVCFFMKCRPCPACVRAGVDKNQRMLPADCHCIFAVHRLLVVLVAVAAWTVGFAPAQAASSSTEISISLQRGQRLLTQYQCGSCHAIPGVAAARGVQGPTLEAFGKRSYIAGRIPNQADHLARWIVQPSALVPDTAMPAMGVSPDQARDMAAYLGSLK